MDAQACSEQSRKEREARIRHYCGTGRNWGTKSLTSKPRWPRHSVPPTILMRLVLSRVEGLEELEEELERLRE